MTGYAEQELPPVRPPAECWSPLLWSLARQILVDHRTGLDGHCVVCRPVRLIPCPPRRLAVAGLAACVVDPAGRDVAGAVLVDQLAGG